LLRARAPARFRALWRAPRGLSEARLEHPHKSSDADFDSLLTTDEPVICAFDADAGLTHRLTFRRKIHGNFHVRVADVNYFFRPAVLIVAAQYAVTRTCTITTPFDMIALNDMDRFHLVVDVIGLMYRDAMHFVVIESFRHGGLEHFFCQRSQVGIQPKHASRIRLHLGKLDSSTCAADMHLPGWRHITRIWIRIPILWPSAYLVGRTAGSKP
jgi:hypothetical protein